MGVDLKVMASNFRERRGELLATAVVRFDRDPHLFSRLSVDSDPRLVRQLPAGLRVGSNEDEAGRYTDEDAYGERLTYTTPNDLHRLGVPAGTGDWNRAVLTFLLALPPETRIVLYWC